ncbi:DUF3089 domain-containing protein [Tenacibaculum soleae]|uniref:DUF3089 domain-containing protein n=1 Tax=Tenacibaculum soleae TaxID=447689 RepID=UPI0026E2E032|nr:DUF3089 domain-containing protein [Tenacibaculum soleae]MDO6811450.1 DUF3089 domain-containing protein [Tenacibaculum soleae]
MKSYRVRVFKVNIAIVLMLALVSCKSTYDTQVFNVKNTPLKPDYQLERSWAVLPSKYPKNFQEYASKQIDTLQADVFFIYPTLNTSKKDNRWNVPLNDEVQNDKVLNSSVLYQASVFATSGRVYVPFYRQAHYRSFDNKYKIGGDKALNLAYQDVKNAFEVYLKKYNKNRPIIIAGHSQGALHAIQLLKDFFDEKPLQKKLIAAYIPGMRVEKDEFISIKPMITPDENGGFVSWNTFKKGHFPKNKKWYKGAVTSNPITWNNEKTTILNQHKGFLYSNGKMYKKALAIQITDGLVWATNPKFPLRFFMSFLKNYHVGDINLFWQDIRENSLLRVKSWKRKQVFNPK